MLRHDVPVRQDLDRIAYDHGFDFHIIDNEIYWDESRAYRFTLRQVEEQIEKPTAELHQMCLDVVERAVNDEQIMQQLAIPPLYWDVIAESWRNRDPSLYGRMDFVWCGNKSPVKLLEYNADTPTSLYESAYFQWLWLEDARRNGVIPRDADQYNAIQERLISRFAELYSPDPSISAAVKIPMKTVPRCCIYRIAHSRPGKNRDLFTLRIWGLALAAFSQTLTITSFVAPLSSITGG